MIVPDAGLPADESHSPVFVVGGVAAGAGAVADGFYQSGPERDYIVLKSGATPARAIVHEYIHLLLNHGTAPLPLWFEEGTAEFYSNIVFSGTRLLVGTPIPEHVAALDSSKSLNAADLGAVTRTSRVYDERARAGVFYAQSWALVHMLNLSPAYRQGMPRFTELLSVGTSSEAAFDQAFGRGMDRAIDELEPYVHQARAATISGSTPGQLAIPEVTRIAATEAAMLRADLALRTSHPEVARRWFLQIARDSSGTAAAETALGPIQTAHQVFALELSVTGVQRDSVGPAAHVQFHRVIKD